MNSCFSRTVFFVTTLCLISVESLAADVKPNDKTFPDGVTFTEAERQAIAAQGPWPMDVPRDPGNELSGLEWAENLGRYLFFNPALSSSGKLSCASCHQANKGFTDGRSQGLGAETGKRNTQGLLNSGLLRWFGWDGGADSLWAASLRPWFSSHEMAADLDDASNVLRADKEFISVLNRHLVKNESLSAWDNEALVVIAGKAIGAYVRILNSGPTSFDRYRTALLNNDLQAQNDYPESAQRGLKIFISGANCRACHFGPNFTNSEFHDIGRPFFTGVGEVDPGRFIGIQRVEGDPFSLTGNYAVDVQTNQQLKTANVKLSQSNWGEWRTPSLRNLTLTAPYMHDGSLPTLRDVVDWYSDFDPNRLHSDGEAILKPLNLNEQQRNDLVAFLESLSLK